MNNGFLGMCFLSFVLFTGSAPAQAGLNIVVSPESVYQGRTMTVNIPGGDIMAARAFFLGKEIPFYASDGYWTTTIGVAANAPEGLHEITVICESLSGEIKRYSTQIEIWPYSFLAEKLVFPPQKSSKLTSRKIAADQEELAAVFRRWTPEKLWDGGFIIPVKGRTTSPYGAYRLYNGKRLGDHRGVDIGGNPAGTPIKASNSGIVAFAKPLPAFGSTVVIDHGQGIHSVYMHLSKTLVTAGQFLNKGDILGRVGSTGISTGPHLHWGISIHDTRVDPIAWADKTAAD